MGQNAGFQLQQANCVAIGEQAGQVIQTTHAVAIGTQAGRNFQQGNAVAIGRVAAAEFQNLSAVAVGHGAGNTGQGARAVALGNFAALTTQGANSVAIGATAGFNRQGADAVAIGSNAGAQFQGANAIAIGSTAGNTGQGANAIAIGNLAGQTNQAANSTVLSARGTALNPGTTGFFVAPIRNGDTGNQVLIYDNGLSEVRYVPRSFYAQYFDTTDQANSGATGNTVSFNTTDFNVGITLASNTNITFTHGGLYAISYSLQFINISSQEQYIDVWFEKNGNVVANTNSTFGITRNQSSVDGKLVAASTFFFNLVPTDYLQIRWFSSSLDVDLEYIAAGAYTPAAPSAFVNAQLISW